MRMQSNARGRLIRSLLVDSRAPKPAAFLFPLSCALECEESHAEDADGKEILPTVGRISSLTGDLPDRIASAAGARAETSRRRASGQPFDVAY
jgi:hypothetical protein